MTISTRNIALALALTPIAAATTGCNEQGEGVSEETNLSAELIVNCGQSVLCADTTDKLTLEVTQYMGDSANGEAIYHTGTANLVDGEIVTVQMKDENGSNVDLDPTKPISKIVYSNGLADTMLRNLDADGGELPTNMSQAQIEKGQDNLLRLELVIDPASAAEGGCVPGSFECTCTENNACNTGLKCDEDINLCMAPDDCRPGVDPYCACGGDNNDECPNGLVCLADVCQPPPAEACQVPDTLYCECDPNNDTCLGGLECDPNSNTCSFPEGGNGSDPCADSNNLGFGCSCDEEGVENSCGAAFVCDGGACNFPPDPVPCGEDNLCAPGDLCVEGVCQDDCDAGSKGCDCDYDDVCDNGLDCNPDVEDKPYGICLVAVPEDFVACIPGDEDIPYGDDSTCLNVFTQMKTGPNCDQDLTQAQIDGALLGTPVYSGSESDVTIVASNMSVDPDTGWYAWTPLEGWGNNDFQSFVSASFPVHFGGKTFVWNGFFSPVDVITQNGPPTNQGCDCNTHSECGQNQLCVAGMCM